MIDDLPKDGLLSHLVELRGGLLRALGAMAVLTILFLTPFTGAPLAGEVYSLLAKPLSEILSANDGQLIAVGVVAPFTVQITTALLAALVLSMPYLWYEIWRFVAPGLYKNEQRLALPLIVSGTALFYLGMLFAYFMVFRVVFGFIAAVAPPGMVWTPDIQEFFSFAVSIFIAFGVAFETPVAVYLLVKTGVVEAETLRQGRRYVIVGAFVIAAVFTPPDVVSQLLLAIPCWLLFELGLLLAPKTKKDDDENTTEKSEKQDD